MMDEDYSVNLEDYLEIRDSSKSFSGWLNYLGELRNANVLSSSMGTHWWLRTTVDRDVQAGKFKYMDSQGASSIWLPSEYEVFGANVYPYTQTFKMGETIE